MIRIGTPTGEPGGGVGGSAHPRAIRIMTIVLLRSKRTFNPPPHRKPKSEIITFRRSWLGFREIAIDGGAITTKEAIFWGVLAVAAGAAIGAYLESVSLVKLFAAVVGAGFDRWATRSYIINET
ncbi:MAG: hypothetical protein IPK58_11875 [Acidobacteria bacterium]|nr:hypothetical protein [Acidobacteriota bacterium]